MRAKLHRETFDTLAKLMHKVNELKSRNIEYTQEFLKNDCVVLHWAELENGFTKSENEKMEALGLWMQDNYEGEFFSIVFDTEKNISSEQVYPVWQKYFSKLIK